MKPLLVAAALIAMAAPAFGADDDESSRYTGNIMLPHCKVLVDSDEVNTPLSGFYAGVISTLFWSQSQLSGRLKFCAPPRSITRGQSRQVVLLKNGNGGPQSGSGRRYSGPGEQISLRSGALADWAKDEVVAVSLALPEPVTVLFLVLGNVE